MPTEERRASRAAGAGGCRPARRGVDVDRAAGGRFLLRPELGLPLITLLLAVYLSFASEYFLQRQNLLNITRRWR